MLSNSSLFQQSQSQLDHSRLTALINSVTDGFLAIDGDGLIELSNSVALSLLDTNSLNGKSIADALSLIDSQGQVINMLDLIHKTNNNFISRDLRLRYADGQAINLYLNISQVKSVFGSTANPGYVMLFRDITKEKNEEDERDDFISVASHELLNPVAIVEGGVSNAITLAQSAQSSDALMQSLNSAHEQIIFLSGLINDLAMISRADRGKFIENAAYFDPVEILQSLQADYRDRAQKKGLQLNLQSVQLPKIFGSQLYTREIMQNFVTNALKYTDKGSITLGGRLVDDSVELSVTDTGFGIDAAEQKRLFTKFFRSEDSRVRKVSGTGLGLYVSLKLAKLMGGNLNLQSELNHGSTFTLRLPIGSAPKPVA